MEISDIIISEEEREKYKEMVAEMGKFSRSLFNFNFKNYFHRVKDLLSQLQLRASLNRGDDGLKYYKPFLEDFIKEKLIDNYEDFFEDGMVLRRHEKFPFDLRCDLRQIAEYHRAYARIGSHLFKKSMYGEHSLIIPILNFFNGKKNVDFIIEQLSKYVYSKLLTSGFRKSVDKYISKSVDKYISKCDPVQTEIKNYFFILGEHIGFDRDYLINLLRDWKLYDRVKEDNIKYFMW